MTGFESLLTGRTLVDRYRIEEVIGRGGMGAVYRATDERLGRPVAVKVVTVAGAVDPEARERLRARFRHEAASAAKLPHHPNVVPVYDYGTDPALGLDFLVMELLRGEDLATRLARTGPPPMADALHVLHHAARGVAVGHRAGLIHRDVKPGNVYLVREEHGQGAQVRVLDFGIAKAVADEDTLAQLTQDGRAPLSPAYASPEQLRGEARITPASDVFSLGALGYQLLTGERPLTEADRGRLSAGMEVVLPSLRARNPAVPDEVDEVIRRALALDPAQRYATAGEMADALARVSSAVEHSPVASALPPAPPVPVAGADDDHTRPAEEDRTMAAPPPAAPVARTAAPGPAARGPAIPPPRRRREEPKGGGLAWLWTLLALGVLGGGGYVAYQELAAPGTRAAPVPADTLGADTFSDTLTLPPEVTDALAQDLEGRRALAEGDYARALGHFGAALQLNPARAEYHDHYGLALLFLGRPSDALPYLEQAIDLDPNLEVAYSHLAQAQARLGNREAAISALQTFLSLTRDPERREMALRRLEELTRPPAPEVQPVEPGPIDGELSVPTPVEPAPTGPPDTINLSPR